MNVRKIPRKEGAGWVWPRVYTAAWKPEQREVLGGTGLSLSCTDPGAAWGGSAVYARGCQLNGSASAAVTEMPVLWWLLTAGGLCVGDGP